MKTCLNIFDPLKPHFLYSKTGVCMGIHCHRGDSNVYPQSMFWAEIWKISGFFIWKFSFFGGKIFKIFEKACFHNVFPLRVPSPSLRMDTSTRTFCFCWSGLTLKMEANIRVISLGGDCSNFIGLNFYTFYCTLYMKMVAVERVLDYSRLPSEAALDSEDNRKPPVDWPQKGGISVCNARLQYSDDSPLILETLSFTIKPNEKVLRLLYILHYQCSAAFIIDIIDLDSIVILLLPLLSPRYHNVLW